MKTYAQTALAIFLVVLGVKLYSLKVDERLDAQITQSREPVFESEQVDQELETLAKIESENVERRLAQLAETGEEEDFASKLSQLDQLSVELEQAIMATGDNFETIDFLKNKIAELKDAGSMTLNNIEEWDKEIIYYLIIEEQMTLEEINALTSPGDLNMSNDDWETMVTQSHTPGFRKKILEYKDVESDFINDNLEALTTGNNQEELIEEIWGADED